MLLQLVRFARPRTAEVAVLITTIALIVWRLWRLRSKVAGTSLNPDRLLRVARIMIDSGMIYSVSVVILFGVNIAGSNALYPVSDVIVQIIVSNGIALNIRKRSRCARALPSI